MRAVEKMPDPASPAAPAESCRRVEKALDKDNPAENPVKSLAAFLIDS
jgi:hypothetical protein